MKLFFALFLILFLAFSGYHLSFRRIRLPLSARKFYLTGTEFLFLGLLLGPQFTRIIDQPTIDGLAPFTALLLGWVGLLFGCQFELPQLRRFPLDYLMAAILQSSVTLAIVLVGVHQVLARFSVSTDPVQTAVIVTLSAAAACTAQTGIALIGPGEVSRNPHTFRLLSYITGIDGLISLTVFSLAFFFRPHPLAPPSWAAFMEIGPTQMAAGGCLMLLYILLLARRPENSELLLVVIGMTIITSGMATLLNFSPLILNFLVGVCLINLSREKERIFSILLNVEKPVYLLLLVFLGVHWQLAAPGVFALAGGLFLLRLAGKWMGGVMITRLIPSLRGYPTHLGLGLLEAGGLPLAIMFDFQQNFLSPLTAPVVSVALLAVIYNDLVSPYCMTRLLGENR